MPVGRIVLVVVGAIVALLGGLATLIGAFGLWAHATQRDADGFFTTSAEQLQTTSYAIVSDEIDLGASPARTDRVVDLGDLATVRLRAEAADDPDDEIFIGIGPEDDVATYLEGVATAEVRDIDVDPFSVEYRYTTGSEPDAEPGTQAFWAVSSEGPGIQTLEWDLEEGRWAVVIMNAAASAGVDASVGAGVKLDWLFGAALGILIGGLVFAIVGAVLLAVGAIGLARHPSAVTEPAPPAASPVRLSGSLDEPLSRWLWLVKWILVIPHLLVLFVLWIAFFVLTVIAFFAILFTGRYPRGVFDFNLGVLRWSWRVAYYSYGALGTDRYPPFTLGAAPDYPATFDVEYPERLSRGLVLVKWWLLAIPHYLVLAIIGGGLGGFGWWAGDDARFLVGGGLLGLLVFFAGVALLFTRRYPPGLFDLVVGLNRWVYRVISYVTLMRDDYPPFRLDQGGRDPAAPPGEERAPEPTAPGW